MAHEPSVHARSEREPRIPRWQTRAVERDAAGRRAGRDGHDTARERNWAVTPERVRTILVVEDDPVLRDAYSEGLSVAGYEVRAASSFAEAGALLQSPVDAVLTDLDLGVANQDGYAVLEEVRRARPGAPVIVVTGTEEPMGGARAIAAGAFAYLLKPVTLGELCSIVARALQGLESLRSRRA